MNAAFLINESHALFCHALTWVSEVISSYISLLGMLHKVSPGPYCPNTQHWALYIFAIVSQCSLSNVKFVQSRPKKINQ